MTDSHKLAAVRLVSVPVTRDYRNYIITITDIA